MGNKKRRKKKEEEEEETGCKKRRKRPQRRRGGGKMKIRTCFEVLSTKLEFQKGQVKFSIPSSHGHNHRVTRPDY